LALTAYFFYHNTDINRGEYGAFDYTITKCLPILALSAIAFVAFRPPVTPIKTGCGVTDQVINLRHPAALAFFLSAIGDWLLANRSNSTCHFTLGVIPFALAHLLNTKFYSRNLTAGQRYWPLAALYLIIHSAILGFSTLGGILGRSNIWFQIVTVPYSLVLGWTVLCAISNWYYDPKRSSNPVTLLYMLGYITFMFSDSILMFDEFGSAITRAQLLVVITYYISQGLIFQSLAMHDVKAKGY